MKNVNNSEQLKILDIIKTQIGLKLNLCNYFTGINDFNGKKYFNVVLNERTSESNDFQLLKNFCNQYKIISIEPNGVNRVAIIIN